MKIEADPLRSGEWYARPAGKLGMCGWSPFPWTIAIARFKHLHAEKLVSLTNKENDHEKTCASAAQKQKQENGPQAGDTTLGETGRSVRPTAQHRQALQETPPAPYSAQGEQPCE